MSGAQFRVMAMDEADQGLLLATARGRRAFLFLSLFLPLFDDPLSIPRRGKISVFQQTDADPTISCFFPFFFPFFSRFLFSAVPPRAVGIMGAEIWSYNVQ